MKINKKRCLLVSLLFFCAGCRSTSGMKFCTRVSNVVTQTTQQSKDVWGSESHIIRDIGVTNSSNGVMEIFAIDYNSFRSVKVRKVSQDRDFIHRERSSAIIGVHEEYNLFSDLCMDYVTPVMYIVGFLYGPIKAITDWKTDEGMLMRTMYSISLLPGISLYKKYDKKEFSIEMKLVKEVVKGFPRRKKRAVRDEESFIDPLPVTLKVYNYCDDMICKKK